MNYSYNENKISTPLLVGFSLFFFFIIILAIILIFVFVPSNSSDQKSCSYDGPIPEPLANEVIGAANNVVLKSTTKNNGYITPCFVYFTSNVTFEKTKYGIRLPVGIYNIYVQYLSYSAVNGDVVSDKLIRTEYIGSNHNTIAQKQIGNNTITFMNNQCLSVYDGVSLSSNANIIRLETAIKGFSNQTLEVDRIEILFQQLLI